AHDHLVLPMLALCWRVDRDDYSGKAKAAHRRKPCVSRPSERSERRAGTQGDRLSSSRVWPLGPGSPFGRPGHAEHSYARAGRANHPRSRAPVRRRHSRMFSIVIRIAGVTMSVSTVAKPSPNTIAVERWIHHCVAGAPITISRATNSTLIPNAIGST